MTLRLYRSDGQRNREHGYGKYLQHSSLPVFVYSNTTRTIYCAGEIDVQLPLHRVRHLGDLGSDASRLIVRSLPRNVGHFCSTFSAAGLSNSRQAFPLSRGS